MEENCNNLRRKIKQKHEMYSVIELQTSWPGGLIWYMQKLWSSKEHASGQKNNPWKQDISENPHNKTNVKLEIRCIKDLLIFMISPDLNFFTKVNKSPFSYVLHKIHFP